MNSFQKFFSAGLGKASDGEFNIQQLSYYKTSRVLTPYTPFHTLVLLLLLSSSQKGQLAAWLTAFGIVVSTRRACWW
jgi:hypothetical protein